MVGIARRRPGSDSRGEHGIEAERELGMQRSGFHRFGLSTLACICAVALGLSPASAAEVGEKLKIFGHLTQAYGESDRGSVQGTTEGGTTDLRKVAVQFRWEVSERDTAVVQISHERRGNDFLFLEPDDVEIDWAFYEIRATPTTAFKVGRLNVPLGIYNEVRDVGTLLPFFNLPISFYAGVLNSAETVDGVSVSQTLAGRSSWPLEVELYFGGWDTVRQQVDPTAEFGIRNFEARAEDGLGVQVWLNTPIEGLRLGAGALTWLLADPLLPTDHKDRWKTFHLSVDATFEKWILRAEHRQFKFDQDFGAFLGLPFSLLGTAERKGTYVQLGYWFTPKLGFFGQWEDTGLSDDVELLAPLDDLHEDLAVSLNYRLRPDLLVRLEFHSAETRLPIGDPDRSMDTVDQSPLDVDWAILAFSVSF